MADYSYKDLMKMQNDAIRRAEDMQRRARQSAGLEKEEAQQTEKTAVKKDEPRRIPMPNGYLDNLKHYGTDSHRGENNTEDNRGNTPQNETGGHNNGQQGFEDNLKNMFGNLNMDSDKALLLSLILLLSQEKADEILIMALIYMLT
ncbi:MAG: hypothetical protein ACI4VW_01770 [Acutalibacteraceae bacterium]